MKSEARSVWPRSALRSLEGLQFGAAYLAEGAQRINRVAVHKLSQFRKRLVPCERRIDNCSNHCLGRDKTRIRFIRA